MSPTLWRTDHRCKHVMRVLAIQQSQKCHCIIDRLPFRLAIFECQTPKTLHNCGLCVAEKSMLFLWIILQGDGFVFSLPCRVSHRRTCVHFRHLSLLWRKDRFAERGGGYVELSILPNERGAK